MLDIAAIKAAVTATDVAERLGLEPGRSGYICCPWHNEDTPSLKLYPESRGWHCFGCGKSGDVIDMVSHVEGLSLQDACEWINREFGLGLSGGRPNRRQQLRWSMKRRQRAERGLSARHRRAELRQLYEQADELRSALADRPEEISDELADVLHKQTLIGLRIEEVTEELAELERRKR